MADQGDPKRVVDAYLTYVAGGEEALLAREHGQRAGGARRSRRRPPGEPTPRHGYREGRWGSREVEITARAPARRPRPASATSTCPASA